MNILSSNKNLKQCCISRYNTEVSLEFKLTWNYNYWSTNNQRQYKNAPFLTAVAYPAIKFLLQSSFFCLKPFFSAPHLQQFVIIRSLTVISTFLCSNSFVYAQIVSYTFKIICENAKICSNSFIYARIVSYTFISNI